MIGNILYLSRMFAKSGKNYLSGFTQTLLSYEPKRPGILPTFCLTFCHGRSQSVTRIHRNTPLGATKLGVQFEKFLVTDRAQILGVFLRGLLKYILKVSGFLFFSNLVKVRFKFRSTLGQFSERLRPGDVNVKK